MSITVVKVEEFSGFGGPLAIETPRGLCKAQKGDAIVTLSNGTRHILAVELIQAMGLDEPNRVNPADPEPAEPEKKPETPKLGENTKAPDLGLSV